MSVTEERDLDKYVPKELGTIVHGLPASIPTYAQRLRKRNKVLPPLSRPKSKIQRIKSDSKLYDNEFTSKSTSNSNVVEIGLNASRTRHSQKACNDAAFVGMFVKSLPTPMPKISKSLPSISTALERSTDTDNTGIKSDPHTIIANEGVQSVANDYFAKQESVNEFQRANRGLRISSRCPASLPDVPYRYKRYKKKEPLSGLLKPTDKTLTCTTETEYKHVGTTECDTIPECNNQNGIMSTSIESNPILDLFTERPDIENKSDFKLPLGNSALNIVESNTNINTDMGSENNDTDLGNKMEFESGKNIPKLTVSLTPLKIAEDSITKHNDTLNKAETDKAVKSKLTLSPISTRRTKKTIPIEDFVKTDHLKLPHVDIHSPLNSKGTFNLGASTSSSSSFQNLVQEDLTNVSTPFRPASDPGRTLPPLNFQSTLREDDNKMIQGDKDWFKVLSDQELTEKITLKMCEDPSSYDTFANTRVSPRNSDPSKPREEPSDTTITVQSNVGFIRTKKGNKRPKKGVFPLFDNNPNGPLQRIGEKTRKRQKKKSA